jgi:hypothetical protein
MPMPFTEADCKAATRAAEEVTGELVSAVNARAERTDMIVLGIWLILGRALIDQYGHDAEEMMGLLDEIEVEEDLVQ